MTSIVGGLVNTASGTCSFIGGGECNYVKDLGSSIVGGRENFIEVTAGKGNQFIGGGICNISANFYSSVVGGDGNCVYSAYGIIGGGVNNSMGVVGGAVSPQGAIIGGGVSNCIIEGGLNSGILGGNTNCIDGHADSFIVGSDIISHAACTTHINNLTVSGSNGGGAGSSVVIMRGLPTSDPSNVGQLWNDGGTLKISI